MSIIFQKDRRRGITYAYENAAYWDKEKKQSRTKRKLIGRLNEETGEIVPTDDRCRKLSPNFPEYQPTEKRINRTKMNISGDGSRIRKHSASSVVPPTSLMRL